MAVGVVGVLLAGGPLWPAALICLAYLVVSFRREKRGVSSDTRVSSGRSRYVLALSLFAISATAGVSGGTLSPFVFSLGGGVALLWPWLAPFSPAEEVVPAGDSIVFRSKYLPFVWHALGELKPGSDPFPRSLSSFSGTLLVFTDTGRVYALATCFALGARVAEVKLSRELKASSPRLRSGAFPFPLDSGAACEVLRQLSSRVDLPSEGLARGATGISGVFILKCSGERVREAGIYGIGELGGTARVPRRGRTLTSPPLVWEVLDGVGKRTRWPDPDPLSSLLDSLNATRGVPLGDRLGAIEASGNEVSLQSLGGVEVRVTRPQLRALVTIYS